MEWDAELLNVFSTKQKPELPLSQPVQYDEKIIQISPNATNVASSQQASLSILVCKCQQQTKFHIFPRTLLYYLPIWWIVMYGSLSCGKSSITSTQGKLCFPIGSTCQVSQLTRVKLCFPIVSTWQVSQSTPVKLRFPIGSACQASQIK